MERTTLAALRAIVINSGNANASTGRPGLDNAAKMQGAAAIASGVGSESGVAVASTGVIGVQLPMEVIIPGIAAAARALRPDGASDFAEAIRTTDAYAKQASLEVTLSGGTVRLSAQAKGAGMISPGFATLLVFVQTDATLSPETADLLLGVTVKRSFERISVDGQMSPSDTVILQASGASGITVEPESDDELRFGEALDATLRQLALMVARDGEGARRIGRVVVRGGDQPPSRLSLGRSPIPRSSRPPCTAGTRTGAASRRPRAPRFPEWRRSRSTSRSRAPRCAPAAASCRTTPSPWRRPSRATRSSTRSDCPGPAPRPRCSSPTSATSTSHQRRLHEGPVELGQYGRADHRLPPIR